MPLREPMHLCTCVTEEGGDGEASRSETPSLLSYTLRYVSFEEVGRVCRVGVGVVKDYKRKPSNLHESTCPRQNFGLLQSKKKKNIFLE